MKTELDLTIEALHSKNAFVSDGVVIGYPFNLQEAVQIFGKDVIPNELGIYHLFYDEQLVYIGMSRKLRSRLLSHLRDADKPFHTCLWFLASDCGNNITTEDILKAERRLIKKFKPSLNIN
jgi:excinuclease UvrABC nuclease subunit